MYFFLLISAISLVIISYILLVPTVLSDLVMKQKLYYAAFLIWRIYPFMIPVVLSIISIKIAAKIHFGIYKNNSTILLFVLVFISTTIWALTHDTLIDFWDNTPKSRVSSEGFTEDSIEIVHEYSTGIDVESTEKLSVLWLNNYGFTQKIYLDEDGFSTEYHPKILTYTDIQKKRKSYVLSDMGEFYSETIIAFFYDRLHKLLHNDIKLRIILYITIGLALSLGTLFLGMFESYRETNISIIIVHTLMSMVLFLFLSRVWILFSIVGLVFFIILMIKILIHRMTMRH